MPLIRSEQTKQAWFLTDCTIEPAQDETEWDFRHNALMDSADHGWLEQPKGSINWIASKRGRCATVLQEHAFLSEKSVNAEVLDLRLRAERLRLEFDALSEKWQRDTRHLSQISKAITHPAYLRIIGMGEAAIPLLLESLRDRPAPWFTALRATANTDPAGAEDNPEQAREAWLQWGTLEGFLR